MIMNKRILFLFTFLLFVVLQIEAYEVRNLLQKKATLEQVKEALVLNQAWVPYPQYQDRAGWDNLLGTYKEDIIKAGEGYLNFDWRVVKATDYLEFERSGNRNIMQEPLGANNRAIGTLLMAELAEGKGRFMDEITNGVLHVCEMSTWALSAHLASYQKSRRAFPDHREHILELTQGDMSQMLSWTYYFLNQELAKIDPIIPVRLRSELQERELNPYMERSDYWWMALNYKPGLMVNNWNPWCNFNALTCFFLLENDPDKLAEAVYKSMQSTDHFINYVQVDGACEEGPSYWGHAAGKLYDYLQMLSLGTSGNISIFDVPQIRYMGEYIVRSYVGNKWVVNFADASAKGGGSPALIYRYGAAVGSNLMKGYAVKANQESSVKPTTSYLDTFRALEDFRSLSALNSDQTTFVEPTYTWYPETEFCYMSNKSGFFLAAKGGYNNESHNHNDAGTFSLYLNTTPMLIDAGVGTYTRQTFSSERYTIWTMQSDYHNLPLINGVPQKFGANYKASEVKANQKQQLFSLNIATAYPDEAQVEKWIRSYQLTKSGLKIEDAFSLKEAVTPNTVNFISWGKIDIATPGTVAIEVEGEQLKLNYDKNQFSVAIMPIKLDDPRLSNVWGAEIYRISLQAKNKQQVGKYLFTITK
ncbi:MAG: heparinase II/III domain-containing protein [Phocaeicola sp.]